MISSVPCRIRLGESEKKQRIEAIQWSVIYVLVGLSTLPALLLGLLVYWAEREPRGADGDPAGAG